MGSKRVLATVHFQFDTYICNHETAKNRSKDSFVFAFQDGII